MTQEISMAVVYIHPTLGQMAGGETTASPTTQAPGGTVPPGGQPKSQQGGNSIFFFAIIMMVGMFLIMSMSGRKEKKKRAAMLSTLVKRDKVRTAGGIIGTIIEVKDDEVLIETDKSSHTRLWLARGSVSTVIDSSHRPTETTESSDSDLEEVSA